jgi:hypothetical protein
VPQAAQQSKRANTALRMDAGTYALEVFVAMMILLFYIQDNNKA